MDKSSLCIKERAYCRDDKPPTFKCPPIPSPPPLVKVQNY